VSANDRDWLGLRDRVCVVTGAAGGIGRETALQLAAAGAKVVAIDRDGSGCAQTAEEVRRQGGATLPLTCDVTRPRAFRRRCARPLPPLAGATAW
jgi:NAD(P)-dependent dehydrogenase (short-subunit alcohol dehydrogenase family)